MQETMLTTLRMWRRWRNLTLKGLAARSHLSLQTVHRLETCQTRAKPDTVAALANALQVEPAALSILAEWMVSSEMPAKRKEKPRKADTGAKIRRTTAIPQKRRSYANLAQRLDAGAKREDNRRAETW